MANTSKYRVEHRPAASSEWTTDDDTITGTTHAVDELACGKAYRFRVSAYGSGATYAAEWSEASAVLAAATECVTPTFDEPSYTFGVPESASTGDSVGAVSATDPNTGDTLAYSVTLGNEDGKFAIDGSTGEITVAGALHQDTTQSYALTVQASDGANTATATVTIVVTVHGGLAPRPQGLAIAPVEGGFSITWDPMPGASQYAVQYRVPGVQDTYSDLPFTENTNLEYRPAGGVLCERVYELRAFARGDGTVLSSNWGQPSWPVSATAGACNRDPVFDAASYAFSVPENVLVAYFVGIASATDPDTGDSVSYSITAGNADGKFTISGRTGAISLVATLDYETTSAYTLTVEAGDGRGGTGDATVTINVMNIAETRPPAPRNLAAEVNDDGSITLSWEAPDDTTVTGYRILRRRPSQGENYLLGYVLNTGSTETTYTDGNVTAGAPHVYRVEAINFRGAGEWSNSVRVTP